MGNRVSELHCWFHSVRVYCPFVCQWIELWCKILSTGLNCVVQNWIVLFNCAGKLSPKYCSRFVSADYITLDLYRNTLQRHLHSDIVCWISGSEIENCPDLPLIVEKADCMPAPIQLNAILRLHSTESHSCVLQNNYIITAAKLSTNFLSKLYISCSIFMCDPCIMNILNNAAANIIIMFHEAR